MWFLPPLVPTERARHRLSAAALSSSKSSGALSSPARKSRNALQAHQYARALFRLDHRRDCLANSTAIEPANAGDPGIFAKSNPGSLRPC